MKVIKGYKFVSDNLKSKEGNCEWVVGEWKKHKGNLKLCSSGFHACVHPFDALKYNYGNRFFLVEAKGKIIYGDDKFVASEMRLLKEVKGCKALFVRFAVWNSRKCLKHFEELYPDDERSRKGIEAAEEWLNNPCDATITAAESAARSAASAAWSAAWYAAWSAAWSAASAAESAAESAASAARSAARSASRKVFKQMVAKEIKKG